MSLIAALLALVPFAVNAPVGQPHNIVSTLEWTAQPGWLGNPGDAVSAVQTDSGVIFRAGAAGRGMKWSANLPAPIDLGRTPWLVVRYRAVNAGEPVGYFVWLGGPGVERNALGPTALVSDGLWRTAVSKVDPAVVTTIAVQLQATGPNAHVEISRIELAAEKPLLDPGDAAALDDTIEGDFRFVDLGSVCNSGARALVDALGLSGWFDSSQISPSGVPFALETGSKCVIATDFDLPTTINIPLGGAQATEVFIFAAGVSEGQPECTEVTEPHQFLARVTRQDGDVFECVPARAGGRFGLTPGFAVYAVSVPAGAGLEELEIVENVRGMSMSVIAVTLGTDVNVFPHARVEPVRRPVLYSPPAERARQTGAAPEFSHGVLSAMGGRLRVSLQPEVAVLEVPSNRLPRFAEGAPLWHIRVGEKELTSSDFVGDYTASGDVGIVSLRDTAGLGVTGSMRIECPNEHSARLSLELEYAGEDSLHVVFPIVRVVDAFGEADVSYCFPRRGAVVNDIPIELRAPYSGLMPLQFMDAWTSDGGICMLTQDLQNVYKFFNLRKASDGVTMSVEYLEHDPKQGEPFRSVPTVLTAHDGDWHSALDLYKEWVAEWYKPDAPRKDWFRRVFNFRQQFLRFFAPGGDLYFDKQTTTYTFPDGLAADTKIFGGVDYLHLFDWGASTRFGRTGDYEPWDEIGGVEAFRSAVADAQEAGVPVGLYIEGYLVEPDSLIGQAHGKEWQILDSRGLPLPYYLPAMNMCSSVVEWQDYLSAVYARVKDQTRAMGYYCDQMGFAAYDHTCYAANHGHPVPEPPLRGQGELMAKIRRALGPEAALYTEETPADFNSQRQDGSFTYSIVTVPDAWSPSHVNLTRFALPDFKTFEIIVCDAPLADRLTAVRQILFNGEGIWLEGPESWFAPEVLEFIRRMHLLTQSYSDCFMSLRPIPLVPTGQRLVFANQFPAAGRTLWTLFNANYSTVRGEMLAIAHTPNAVYWDAWNDRPIEPRIEGDTAYLNLELAPRDIACVVQTLP